MLPKKSRLIQRQVRYILAKAKRNRFNVYVFCAMPNRADVHRFGVMISTKVYPKAVERNRARRKIYGVIEKWLNTKGKAEVGYNVMIIVCRPIGSENLEKLPHFLSKTLI